MSEHDETTKRVHAAIKALNREVDNAAKLGFIIDLDVEQRLTAAQPRPRVMGNVRRWEDEEKREYVAFGARDSVQLVARITVEWSGGFRFKGIDGVAGDWVAKGNGGHVDLGAGVLLYADILWRGALPGELQYKDAYDDAITWVQRQVRYGR